MNTVNRLISQFTPSHYNLSLDLQRKERQFNGLVTIEGSIAATQQAIQLHSKDLAIDSVTINGNTATWREQPDDILTLEQAGFSHGDYIVVIAFHGAITDAMHGLYPCYFEHDGAKKELLATQFESHHAREVFPCVDEPSAKATFDVTLTTEKDVVVLGNQPVQLQREEDDRLVTTFATTPKMSVYLLAWVVGELHKRSATTKNGVEVNVWATPVQPLESLDFALDIATRAIDFYDQYFDTPYPLPKSDHVALPDFSSGAMENWGLITYREIALLADPATTSITSKQYIATVITHELAHQWFGNLVTMAWWDDLWLNESFATLMEYVAVDALHPEWNIWLDFSTSESVLALRRDSLGGVQSVKVDVHHPDEISTLFDGAIVYAKGARLLRMVRQFIGDDAFQTGLKQYFKQYAYKNTIGDNLWDALSKSSGQDVKTMMDTWLLQPGYPVLHASKNDDGSITLTQEQFFTGPHQQSKKIWQIPLNATCGQMPKLLTEKTATIPRSHTSSIRFNDGDSAHFITHYDSGLFAQIIEDVEHNRLSPIDRLQLLSEQSLLARGGIIASADLLPLLRAFRNETSEPVWSMIALTIGELKKFAQQDDITEELLRAFTQNLAAPLYNKLGWQQQPGESEEDTKLRSLIIGLTLYGELPDAIEHAREVYNSTPIESINPELRPVVLSAVARYGDEAIIGDLLQHYKSTQSADLQQDIAIGITSTRSQDSIRLLLTTLRDTSVIKTQDTARWFVYLIRGRESHEQAWQWLRDNWNWIKDTFGGDKSYDEYPRYAATGCNSRQHLEAYREFFEPMQYEPALSRAIQLGISEIEGRVASIERDHQAVRDTLIDLAETTPQR